MGFLLRSLEICLLLQLPHLLSSGSYLRLFDQLLLSFLLLLEPESSDRGWS